MKTISVVTTTWNNLYVSQLCVEYFRKYAGVEHKFVVVDNNSTDGSKQYFTELERQGTIDKLISNQDNYGAARGRNQGILAFDTDYTCLIDSDHIFGANWLKILYDYFESTNNKKLGILSSGGVLDHLHNEPYISTLVRIKKVVDKYSDLRNRTVQNCRAYINEMFGDFDSFVNQYQQDFKSTVTSFGGISACLVKREIFDTVGLFDERYKFCMVEDHDWWERIFNDGWIGESVIRAFSHHFAGTTTHMFDKGSVQTKHYAMRVKKLENNEDEILSPENLSIAKTRFKRYQ